MPEQDIEITVKVRLFRDHRTVEQIAEKAVHFVQEAVRKHYRDTVPTCFVPIHVEKK
jgi:ribosomal protein L31E